MKAWILKTAVQRTISWLPWSHTWNELLQRYVTKGLVLDAKTFESKVNCCRRHLEHYRTFSPNPRNEFTVQEIGTGWFPIIPIGLYLCGAGRIVTYDLRSFLHADTFRRTLELFAEFDRTGQLLQLLPMVQADRMQRLKDILSPANRESPEVSLARMNIHAVIQDVRDGTTPAGSIDLIFSNFVLEHIEPEEMALLFAEFKRVLSPAGVMTHFIGLADQYAGFDRSITEFNFLQYSKREWRLFNNSIIPLNRLRISDYRKLLVDGGYQILKELSTSGSLDELREVQLAAEFRNYSEEDLVVLWSWLVARPAQASSDRPRVENKR